MNARHPRAISGAPLGAAAGDLDHLRDAAMEQRRGSKPRDLHSRAFEFSRAQGMHACLHLLSKIENDGRMLHRLALNAARPSQEKTKEDQK
jgi:hypothetical protein